MQWKISFWELNSESESKPESKKESEPEQKLYHESESPNLNYKSEFTHGSF